MKMAIAKATPAKKILLVEDHQLVVESFQTRCDQDGYEIVHAGDKQHARMRLDSLKKNESFAVTLIDCGLPEGTRAGVELAAELRARDPEMKIVVYTLQSATDLPFDLVVRQLLALGVSFLNVNPTDNIYEDLTKILYFAERGYVMQSSTPAKFLNRAIAVEPDPLKVKHWQLLKLLNEGVSRKEAAGKVSISQDTVPDWLDEIKVALTDRIQTQHASDPDSEHESYAIEFNDLLIWYRENWVKYCHE